jgi:hypothetical protein
MYRQGLVTETQAWILLIEVGVIALVYLLSLFGGARRP